VQVKAAARCGECYFPTALTLRGKLVDHGTMERVEQPESSALGRGGNAPPSAPDQRNCEVRASDQRAGVGATAVRKSLSSVLSGLNRPARGIDVAAALDTCLELPEVIGCLNPLCDNKCDWPTGRGRPRDYCSRGCRQSALRTHARLLGELLVIEHVLPLGDLRKAERVRLEARAAQTRWCLRRYATAVQQSPERNLRDDGSEAKEDAD
jgi:hypothetical protein